MKVAVSTTGTTLDAAVDPRFGRCSYFLFVDTDDLTFEVVENESSSLGGGAGIQSGQLMARKGVQVVLTGSCGPNAHKTLTAADIQVVVGCGGTVGEAIALFKSGQLSPAKEPNAKPGGVASAAAAPAGVGATDGPDNVASHAGMGGKGQ